MKFRYIKIMLVVLVALAGCTGPHGNARLKYSWLYKPLYLYDENPSTPSTVFNDEYFDTDPGTFYMEYTAWDGSGWWMYYTITVNEGLLFFIPGDDLWFEITLYSSGPTLWKWSTAFSMPGPPAVGKPVERSPDHSSLARGPVEGTEERIYEYGSIEIEYGQLMPVTE